jgi:NADH-quinone oxidoreductase subunit E
MSPIPPGAAPRGAGLRAAAAALRPAPPQAAPPPPEPRPFPPPELAEACEAIVARYPTRMAAALPILHLAQRHNGGWVDPELEAGVAAWLGVPDQHVRGLLTFYAMFNARPMGRHEVWVCRTLTCWLRGAEALTRTALEVAGAARTGEPGADGRFAVKEMECLGVCEAAPVVWVGGRPCGDATPESLRALMEACGR